MPRKEQDDRSHLVVAERQRIRTACGGPKYEAICKIASDSPLGVGSHKHGKPSLTKTTVGNFFNGVQAQPGWDVAGPILWACYQYAKDTGLMPEVDPALEARTSWEVLTKLSFSQQPEQNINSTDITQPPPAADVIAKPSKPEGRAVIPPARPGDEFSAEHRWYLNTYGQLGADLHRAAATGDSEAAYCLGSVLAADRQPHRAIPWLAAATESQHLAASQLLTGDVTTKAGLALAVEHTYRLGYTAHHGIGDLGRAEFYYTYAANRGHSDAAYHLAHLFLSRGENGTAARWLTVASAGDNRDAKRQLQKLMQRVNKNVHRAHTLSYHTSE
ncbi:hypothetical protein Sme01_23130 [Sphaerisporangium melleum]|uniref:Sel1 repeat family protein n=1 Tax=Sphaerisporangium melleum TaxID=321316 RepID=A0A917VGP4_9ACTN|nr:hypothetical protein GCM10007964_21240 [Sphaerisporangium melleum]GII69837.1 hypothetical protein Sme01_23130 [Sphaerisporangium melleum]